MSFTTPPTFVDGNILSASQLNILAANQTYLSGIVNGVNLGFPIVVLAEDEEQTYHIVHTYDNLYYDIGLDDDDTEVQIYYDATMVFSLVGAPGGGGNTGNHDISGDGLTVGQAYTMNIVCRASGGPAGNVTVVFVAESSEAL